MPRADLLTDAQADALLCLARSPWRWATAGSTTNGLVALRSRGLVASERVPASRAQAAWTRWTVTDAGRAKVTGLELALKATEMRRRGALGSATVPRWALLRLLRIDGDVRGPDSTEEAKAALRDALGVADAPR